MMSMIEKLKALSGAAKKDLGQISDSKKLENWRVKYLGRKGEIPGLLRGIKDLPQATRKETGQLGNKVRRELEVAYKRRLSRVESTEKTSANNSGKIGERTQAAEYVGHFHPLSVAIRRLHKILTAMGFLLAEGPLVEDPKYAFDGLNIPLEHPARGMWDTFYLAGGQVLRPHTSPVQLRAVIENGLTPPFKVYSPGRVFRAERTDASHQHTFYQVEALMVEEDVTVADFKGIAEYLFNNFFGQETTIRLRPSYFPFVEPGFEVDMKCIFCGQKGCGVCKQTGWIEMMGAGMVHPNVLRNMNIDPDTARGFAFGGGIDRLTMLLHGIDDIRLFLAGELRFLRQFY